MDVGVLARVLTGQDPGVNERTGAAAHVRRRRFVAHREQAARDEQDRSDRRDTAGPCLQATCTSHATSVARCVYLVKYASVLTPDSRSVVSWTRSPWWWASHMGHMASPTSGAVIPRGANPVTCMELIASSWVLVTGCDSVARYVLAIDDDRGRRGRRT